MPTTITFTVTPWMTRTNNDDLQAHGRASLIATWIAITTGRTYNRLATVKFNDSATLQQRQDTGLTDFWFIILAEEIKNDWLLSFWIAQENSGWLAAYQHRGDGQIKWTQAYADFACERKLTPAEIQRIFAGIFAHPSVIAPIASEPGSLKEMDTQKPQP